MRTRFIIRGAAGRKGVFMIPIQWKQNDKKTMHVNEAENGVVYLTWPAIEKIEGIRHAFSTRIGGVSKEHLSSMNLSFSRGDDPANVRENYRRFCEAAGFEVENIVTSDQAHTTKVRYVTKADCGSGVTRDRDFHDIDGMITDEPGVVLATFYADCVPLYFVDPVHRAIGLSHSGWRGTVHKMGQATLDAMHERFGTEAKDVIAAVGPSICQDCYEVSGDVIEEFRAAFPETLHEKLFYGKPDGKYQLNLWEANHQILLTAECRRSRFICRTSAPAATRISCIPTVRRREKEETSRHSFPWSENRIENRIESIKKRTWKKQIRFLLYASGGHKIDYLCFASSLLIFSVVDCTFATDTSWLSVSMMLAIYLLISAGSYQGRETSSGVR